MDDLVYANSPVHYLANMPADHPYIELYNLKKAIICVGQGPWELPDSTRQLQWILQGKGIDAWVDFWGYDCSHDWYWWYRQVEYFEAAKRADALAMQIKKAFEDKGVPFAVESFTNQQFVILTEQQKQVLAQKYYFEDEGDTQRFCTSWATTEDEVAALVADIAAL